MTTIAVFGSSATLPGSPEWHEAEALGSAIAELGWTVATGGYAGTMQAVSAGAAGAGGRVFGVTAPQVFPDRAGPNPHVTDELPEPSITARIARLVDLSDAAIALPGSIGTFAELVVAWNVAYLAPMSNRPRYPVVAVGPTWERLLTAIGSTLPTGDGCVFVARSADEGLAHIRRVIPENPAQPE